VSCGDDAIETDVEGDASVSVGVGGRMKRRRATEEPRRRSIDV
jgi:hypothetical protein